MLEPRPQNGEPEPYRDEDGDGAREGRVRACIREQEAEGEGASEGPREKEEKRLEGPSIRSRTRFQGRFGTHASCIPGGSDETSRPISRRLPSTCSRQPSSPKEPLARKLAHIAKKAPRHAVPPHLPMALLPRSIAAQGRFGRLRG